MARSLVAKVEDLMLIVLLLVVVVLLRTEQKTDGLLNCCCYTCSNDDGNDDEPSHASTLPSRRASHSPASDSLQSFQIQPVLAT